MASEVVSYFIAKACSYLWWCDLGLNPVESAEGVGTPPNTDLRFWGPHGIPRFFVFPARSWMFSRERADCWSCQQVLPHCASTLCKLASIGRVDFYVLLFSSESVEPILRHDSRWELCILSSASKSFTQIRKRKIQCLEMPVFYDFGPKASISKFMTFYLCTAATTAAASAVSCILNRYRIAWLDRGS